MEDTRDHKVSPLLVESDQPSKKRKIINNNNARPRTSGVWAAFQKQNNHCICLLCSANYSVNTSTSNLLQHLNKVHGLYTEGQLSQKKIASPVSTPSNTPTTTTITTATATVNNRLLTPNTPHVSEEINTHDLLTSIRNSNIPILTPSSFNSINLLASDFNLNKNHPSSNHTLLSGNNSPTSRENTSDYTTTTTTNTSSSNTSSLDVDTPSDSSRSINQIIGANNTKVGDTSHVDNNQCVDGNGNGNGNVNTISKSTRKGLSEGNEEEGNIVKAWIILLINFYLPISNLLENKKGIKLFNKLMGTPHSEIPSKIQLKIKLKEIQIQLKKEIKKYISENIENIKTIVVYPSTNHENQTFLSFVANFINNDWKFERILLSYVPFPTYPLPLPLPLPPPLSLPLPLPSLDKKQQQQYVQGKTKGKGKRKDKEEEQEEGEGGEEGNVKEKEEKMKERMLEEMIRIGKGVMDEFGIKQPIIQSVDLQQEGEYGEAFHWTNEMGNIMMERRIIDQNIEFIENKHQACTEAAISTPQFVSFFQKINKIVDLFSRKEVRENYFEEQRKLEPKRLPCYFKKLNGSKSNKKISKIIDELMILSSDKQLIENSVAKCLQISEFNDIWLNEGEWNELDEIILFLTPLFESIELLKYKKYISSSHAVALVSRQFYFRLLWEEEKSHKQTLNLPFKVVDFMKENYFNKLLDVFNNGILHEYLLLSSMLDPIYKNEFLQNSTFIHLLQKKYFEAGGLQYDGINTFGKSLGIHSNLPLSSSTTSFPSTTTSTSTTTITTTTSTTSASSFAGGSSSSSSLPFQNTTFPSSNSSSSSSMNNNNKPFPSCFPFGKRSAMETARGIYTVSEFDKYVRLVVNPPELPNIEFNETHDKYHVKHALREYYINYCNFTFHWWKSNQHEFPVLSKLAKIYLSLPSTYSLMDESPSSLSLSSFSTTSLKHSSNSYLLSNSVSNFVFVKENIHLCQKII